VHEHTTTDHTPPDADSLQAAASRLGSYLTERDALGGKDVIHGYLDGAGELVVELRASDLQLLLAVLEQCVPAGVVPRQRRDGVEIARTGMVDSGDEQEDRRRMSAAETLLAAWPGEFGEDVLAAVGELDAFGALAWNLERVRRDGRDPVALLREIDSDTVEWAIRSANNPAAFLASRVQKLGQS
jgi:hypothetical protein